MENRAPKEKTVILIAAYNEEKDIAGVVSGSKKYAGHVLVVDDGSEDGTLKEAAEAGATVIRHQRRQGKGAAIKSGLQYIIKNFGDFEAVITLDGDGQHRPADIKKILSARASKNPGLLIGARNYGRMPFGRRFWNGFISFLISRIIGQKISDSQSGFRLLGRRLVLILAESSGRDDYCVESEIIFLAIKNKIKMAETGVGTVYKKEFSLKTLGKDLIRSGQIFIFVIRQSFDFYPRFKLFLKIILIGLFFISFPHLILTDYAGLKNSTDKDYSLGEENYLALKWLKENSLPADIVLSEWTQGNNIVALANRRVVVSSKVYPSEAEEVASRYKDLSRFFYSASPDEALGVLNKYQVSWVFVKKKFDDYICRYTGRCLWPSTLISGILSDKKVSFMQRAYESKNLLIYRVTDGEKRVSQPEEMLHLAGGIFDEKLIKAGFDSANQAEREKIEAAGIIVPHHYPYNNYLLTDLLSRIEAPKEVVILGPEHNPSGGAVKTSLAIWETPFGEILPAKETIKSVSQKNILIDNEAYLNEWSISSLLPYIKYIYPETRIVPILVNDNIKEEQIRILTGKLADENSSETLFILSSDFVHKLSQEEAEKADAYSAQVISSLNSDKAGDLVMDARGGLKLFLAIMKKQGIKSAQMTGRSDNYQESQKHEEFKPYPYLVTYLAWIFKK